MDEVANEYEWYTEKKKIPFLKFGDDENSIIEKLNILIQVTEANLNNNKHSITKLQILKLQEGYEKLIRIENLSDKDLKDVILKIGNSIKKIQSEFEVNKTLKKKKESGAIDWPKGFGGWMGYIFSAILLLITLLFPWIAIIGTIVFVAMMIFK